MKKFNIYSLFVVLFSLFFATQLVFSQQIIFNKTDIDSGSSFRGLSVVDNSVIWVGGQGIGRSTNAGKTWTFTKIKGFEKLDFRSLYAFDAMTAIAANAGSPTYIFRTSDGGQNWNIVYKNTDSLAFFDGIDFWNNKDGIIYGDPINGKMLLLTTKDAGLTWKELPEESRPALFGGEASFASSGTGIRCYKKNRVIIVTGGKISRLLVSDNKGKSWNYIGTPIIQGKESTGIFSVAFTNDSTGIIVGGNYLIDTLKTNIVFNTTNLGKTWNKPTIQTGGYRSCVEFISDTSAIAVGPIGAEITDDTGKTWTPIANAQYYNVIRKARKGTLIIAAGSKRIAVVAIK